MTSKRGQFRARVFANQPICREHFRLVLEVWDFPQTEPGQFVQVLCRDLTPDRSQCDLDWPEGRWPGVGELNAPEAMLRRPFSLAGRADHDGGFAELEIIHRVVGVGTGWLSQLAVGDEVGILGPLGNRFELPRANETALLVGGGVGIPPMIYLAEKVAGRAVAFCGAVSRDLLPLTIRGQEAEEFARHQIPTIITTDDGSMGVRGYVTGALEAYLDRQPDNSRFVIYTCGPEVMMKKVAAIALARGIQCQVAVERAMACGMGTCQSCVIRVKQGTDWRYKLACTDGPVFEAGGLLW